MTKNEQFMEALSRRRIDFDHYCARVNQLRCMEGIVTEESEIHRAGLLKDISALVGALVVDVWLDSGGSS